MDTMLYVVTTSDGRNILSRTKRVKNAVRATTHLEYMRIHAFDIYYHWLEAMRTKRSLRTIRWWEVRDGRIVMAGNPTPNAYETYVAKVAMFLGVGKNDSDNDPIVVELLMNSLNAREKRALDEMSAQARQDRQTQ